MKIKRRLIRLSLVVFAAVFSSSSLANKWNMGPEMPVHDDRSINWEMEAGRTTPVPEHHEHERLRNEVPDMSVNISPTKSDEKIETVPANKDQKEDKLIKPPFDSTPMGQPLGAGVLRSDDIDTTATPNNKQGGEFGANRGERTHKGVDENLGIKDKMSDQNARPVRYTGIYDAEVIRAGTARTAEQKSLGERVEVRFTDNEGNVWTSKVMHMQEIEPSLKERMDNQKTTVVIKPGEIIGYGGGTGDQFSGNETGASHIHWETTVNGVHVSPNTGEPLN